MVGLVWFSFWFWFDIYKKKKLVRIWFGRFNFYCKPVPLFSTQSLINQVVYCGPHLHLHQNSLFFFFFNKPFFEASSARLKGLRQSMHRSSYAVKLRTELLFSFFQVSNLEKPREKSWRFKFGEFANFVGSHFWNFQVRKAKYSKWSSC